MIAAHAIASRSVLVTNEKAFGNVEDLSASFSWANDP
jgi:predicted nucleic acid-binding protein